MYLIATGKRWWYWSVFDGSPLSQITARVMDLLTWHWTLVVRWYLTRSRQQFPILFGQRNCTLILNTWRTRQNRCHFPDDVFKCNFLNENVWIPITISLKFVPKGTINNIPALFQIMASRRTGDKPLSEPMMTQFNDAYMRHSASIS